MSTFDIKEIVSFFFPSSNPPVSWEEAELKTPALKEHGNSDRFPTTNAQLYKDQLAASSSATRLPTTIPRHQQASKHGEKMPR